MVELSEDNPTINNNEDAVIKNQKPLYTQEQRDSFVRAFIEAWRTNRVIIDRRILPTTTSSSSSLYFLNDKRERPLTVATVKTAPELEKIINDKIKIASGSINTPPTTISLIINELYNDILDMQKRGYTTGTFLDSEVEDRIFERLKKILDQHIEKIRNELGLDVR